MFSVFGYKVNMLDVTHSTNSIEEISISTKNDFIVVLERAVYISGSIQILVSKAFSALN